jgi:hypothetical protein
MMHCGNERAKRTDEKPRQVKLPPLDREVRPNGLLNLSSIRWGMVSGIGVGGFVSEVPHSLQNVAASSLSRPQ